MAEHEVFTPSNSALPACSPPLVAHPSQVVVVSALRTPIGKVWPPACLPSGTRHAHHCVPSLQATRGAFKSTTPDDLLLAVLRATAVQSGVAPSEVQDIAVGNVQLSGAYAGPARMSMLRAGFPASVPLYTVNRQCSSGLQAVANIAASIRSGSISTGIAAGVESMSFGGAVGGGDLPPANWDEIQAKPNPNPTLTLTQP
jgi:acetyl-CoA acetyltransferase